MRVLGTALALTLVLGPGCTNAGAPTHSLRPEARVVASIAPQARAEVARQVSLSTEDQGLGGWIGDFRGRAIAAGIEPAVYDRAMSGLRYDADVVRRDRNQSEFTKTIWEYLDSAASAARVENGRRALREHGRILQAIEDTYGVDKEVVVAVWGLESAYGTYRGDTPILQALATLAYDGRRGDFFEEQLIAALKIIQAGDVAPSGMTGSWAGAMGHTQFMPTSYLSYAVDFHGDGQRDIWSDDPTDALASTAAYLSRFGWREGQPWGVEVRLPRGFDYSLASRGTEMSPPAWAERGVVGLDDRPVPNYGAGSILLPAGAQGAAFMVFDNFEVIERYNAADAYVIGVGHLADRIAGGPPIRSDWPRADRSLAFAERKELQARLTREGFSTRGVDGRIGPDTVSAIRAYQRAAGLVPDGYASLDLLQQLR